MRFIYSHLSVVTIVGVSLLLLHSYKNLLSQNVPDVYIEEEVKTELDLAREYEAQHKYREAIEQYERVIKKYPMGVYRLSPHYYLGLRYYFYQQLLKNPAALNAYRQMYDATSKALYFKALETQDPTILTRIINEMFLTTWGDNAANLLADILIEQGEIAYALNLWNMILDHYPDSELKSALFLIKIAMGAKYLDNHQLYQKATQILRKDYLNEIINLSGKELEVSEVLESLNSLVIAQSRSIKESDILWREWGGNGAHNLAAAWDSKNDVKLGEITTFVSSNQHPSALSPIFYPIVVNNHVFLNTGASVMLIELSTGKRIGSYPIGNLTLPQQIILDNQVFSCVYNDGKIYANLINSARRGIRPYLTYLACFDAQTLKHYWDTLHQLSQSDVLSDINVLSPPLVYNNRVYAAGLREIATEVEVYLFAFDDSDGRLVWERFICSLLKQGRTPSLGLPTIAQSNGIIICQSNQGVIAALNAQTAEVIWLINYAKEHNTNPSPRLPSEKIFLPVSYPVIKDNVVWATFPGVKKLCGYDLMTGKKKVECMLDSEFSYIVGVTDNLIVTQGARFQSFYTTNGKRAGEAPISGEISGYGFLSQNYLYIPYKDRLQRYDLQKELKVFLEPKELFWSAPDESGTIVVVGNYLLSSSKTKLSIYVDLDSYADVFNRQLQARPTDWSLIKPYVDLMISNKHYAEAIRVLRPYLEHLMQAQPKQTSRIDSLKKDLVGLYEKLGEQMVKVSSFSEAITHYQQALALVGPSGRTAGLFLKLGDAYEATQAVQEAVKAYQQALTQPSTMHQIKSVSERLYTIKSDLYATLKIADLIRKHPKIYQLIQKEADKIYAQENPVTKQDLLNFYRRYPYSAQTKDILLKLANQTDSVSESIFYLRQLKSYLGDTPRVLEIIPHLVEAYLKAKDYPSLLCLMEELRAKFPQETLYNKRVEDWVIYQQAEIQRLIKKPRLRSSGKVLYDFTQTQAGKKPFHLLPENIHYQGEKKKLFMQIGSNIEAWNLSEELRKPEMLWKIPSSETSFPEKPAQLAYAADGHLFIQRPDLIQKIESTTGKVLWSYKTQGTIAAWRAAREAVYLIANIDKPDPERPHFLPPYTHVLISLDATTGEILWEVYAKGQIGSRLELLGGGQALVVGYQDHLEIIQTSDGKIIHHEKIPNTPNSFYNQSWASFYDKLYLVDQSYQLIAYEICTTTRKNLGTIPMIGNYKDFLNSQWISASDNWVALAYTTGVTLFNRRENRFITFPTITKSLFVDPQPSTNPVAHIRSVIDGGRVYFWSTFPEKEKKPFREIGYSLLCLDPAEPNLQKQIQWQTNILKGSALELIGLTEDDVVLKYKKTGHPETSIIIRLDKENGRLKWIIPEPGLKTHPALNDVSVGLLYNYLVISHQDGIYIY